MEIIATISRIQEILRKILVTSTNTLHTGNCYVNTVTCLCLSHVYIYHNYVLIKVPRFSEN